MQYFYKIGIYLILCLSISYSQELLSTKQIQFNKKIKREMYKLYKKEYKNLDTSKYIPVIYVHTNISDLTYRLVFSYDEIMRKFEIKEGNEKVEIDIKNYLKQYGYYIMIYNMIIYFVDYNEYVIKTGTAIKSREPFIDIECSKIKKVSWSGY